jgi:hypothetical protein
MFLRPLLAALVAVSSPLASEPERPTAYFVNIGYVEQVWCTHSAGTAFIAGGHKISVAHVTNEEGCRIGNRPIVAHREKNDFSTIEQILPVEGLKINCDGFKEGEQYWAIGYAQAFPVQRAIPLTGTGEMDHGEALLIGYPTVIPGMSGGPILDSQGRVVGTINMYSTAYPLSWSVQLKDTSVCSKI